MLKKTSYPPSCLKLKAHSNLFLYKGEKGKNKTKNPTKTLTMSPLQKQKQKQNQYSNLLTFLEIKPKFPLIDCRLPNMQRIHTPKFSCVSKQWAERNFVFSLYCHLILQNGSWPSDGKKAFSLRSHL